MDRSVSSSVCVRTMDTVILSMESVIVLQAGWDNFVIEVGIVLYCILLYCILSVIEVGTCIELIVLYCIVLNCFV